MPERELVGLVYTPRVADAEGLVHSLAESLGLGDRCWFASATELEISEDTLSSTSVIITAGGDGTILRVVRVAAPAGVPILGVNLGRVGFMTELSVEDAVEKIPAYLGGHGRVENRMMLHAFVISHPGQAPRFASHALNDVVVARGAAAKILDIKASVDGVPLTTFRADGVIVATATGSTGYALSAGGPILYPEVRVILLQSLAAHMSLHTGLVVDEGSVVELSAAGETEGMLSVDGFMDTTLAPEEKIVIERSPHTARFLRAEPASTFYSNLFDRLGVKEAPDSPRSKQ